MRGFSGGLVWWVFSGSFGFLACLVGIGNCDDEIHVRALVIVNYIERSLEDGSPSRLGMDTTARAFERASCDGLTWRSSSSWISCCFVCLPPRERMVLYWLPIRIFALASAWCLPPFPLCLPSDSFSPAHITITPLQSHAVQADRHLTIPKIKEQGGNMNPDGHHYRVVVFI